MKNENQILPGFTEVEYVETGVQKDRLAHNEISIYKGKNGTPGVTINKVISGMLTDKCWLNIVTDDKMAVNLIFTTEKRGHAIPITSTSTNKGGNLALSRKRAVNTLIDMLNVDFSDSKKHIIKVEKKTNIDNRIATVLRVESVTPR